MSTIHLSFDVQKPLEEVWEFGLQTERIPEWQFDIAGVDEVQGSIHSPGYAYTLIYRIAGRDLRSPVQVTRFEPPTLIETSGRTPIGGVFCSTSRMQAAAQGTRVDWQMEYQLPLGIIGRFLDWLIFRRAFRETVRKYNENFKAIAEGRPAPHAAVSVKPKGASNVPKQG